MILITAKNAYHIFQRLVLFVILTMKQLKRTQFSITYQSHIVYWSVFFQLLPLLPPDQSDVHISLCSWNWEQNLLFFSVPIPLLVSFPVLAATSSQSHSSHYYYEMRQLLRVRKDFQDLLQNPVNQCQSASVHLPHLMRYPCDYRQGHKDFHDCSTNFKLCRLFYMNLQYMSKTGLNKKHIYQFQMA